MKKIVLGLAAAILAWATPAHASIGYGTLSNFDTVNDTGVPAHGFEIEIEGCRSREVGYTYTWNHYGTPSITEDLSDPLNPKSYITYAARKLPDGSWSAYTAVPTGPISPTNGHQFTDPSVNFGGEHFGASFWGNATAVRYFWLIDDGAGNLVRGGQVNIATPTFTYYAPINGLPAQADAVIAVPPPAEPPVYEFGDAMWVKVTSTKLHNNHKVELRDLASDDPEDPNDKNWRNGEVEEVDIRWRIMQTDHGVPDGGVDHEVQNAPEDLPDGDEVVTLRYDFYKYVGPYDTESHKAIIRDVAADDLHGAGRGKINRIRVDFADYEVVGDYIGAQMAGFDVAQQLGLAEHVQDGEVGIAYPERLLVLGGTPPVISTFEGNLPEGMEFNSITGILSGTPAVAGVYTFTINSTDAAAADVTTTYNLSIAEAGEVLPAHYSVRTLSNEGGTTSGDGEFELGALASVEAIANEGYVFANWTEAGSVVSDSPVYTFEVDVNHDLVANFTLVGQVSHTITTASSSLAAGTATGGGSYNTGDSVTVVATPNAGYTFVNWTVNGVEQSTSASYTFTANSNLNLVANFQVITYKIATSSSPAAAGATSGGGTLNSGSNATVIATANVGYTFSNWTEGGVVVSTTASYTFAVTGNRTLVANFVTVEVPTTVTALTVPATITGGSTVACSVKISKAAPAGGLSVALSSTSPATLSVPASVLIPAGSTTASFNAKAAVVKRNTDVTLTATYGTSKVSAVARVK